MRSRIAIAEVRDKPCDPIECSSNPAGQCFSYLAAGDYTLVATAPRAELPPRDLSKYDAEQHTEAKVVGVTVLPHQLVPAQINF